MVLVRWRQPAWRDPASQPTVRWLRDAKISTMHIDTDGTVLTATSHGINNPALRRAQALAATDETLATGTLSAATWARCEEHVGGHDSLVELVVAIGAWRLVSQLTRSLHIPLEDGVASWPPDGLVPQSAAEPT